MLLLLASADQQDDGHQDNNEQQQPADGREQHPSGDAHGVEGLQEGELGHGLGLMVELGAQHGDLPGQVVLHRHLASIRGGGRVRGRRPGPGAHPLKVALPGGVGVGILLLEQPGFLDAYNELKNMSV